MSQQKKIAVDVCIDGKIEDPQLCCEGPYTDVTGCMDFRDIRGPVFVTLNLKTELPLRFTELLTSDSPFRRPKPHTPDGHGQFRDVKVGATVITFDYANRRTTPFHLYALKMVDDAGREFVLDPYIRNGGGDVPSG
jgi:hypothetical protein